MHNKEVKLGCGAFGAEIVEAPNATNLTVNEMNNVNWAMAANLCFFHFVIAQ